MVPWGFWSQSSRLFEFLFNKMALTCIVNQIYSAFCLCSVSLTEALRCLQEPLECRQDVVMFACTIQLLSCCVSKCILNCIQSLRNHLSIHLILSKAFVLKWAFNTLQISSDLIWCPLFCHASFVFSCCGISHWVNPIKFKFVWI